MEPADGRDASSAAAAASTALPRITTQAQAVVSRCFRRKTFQDACSRALARISAVAVVGFKRAQCSPACGNLPRASKLDDEKVAGVFPRR